MDLPNIHDRNARPRTASTIVVQDVHTCIPLGRVLGRGDLLYLLTPVVMPDQPERAGSPPRDPFEPFGRALAKHHPWVRHVPYLARGGITQYHAEHLALAKAVVFVISGPPCAGQPSQVALAQRAWSFTTGCPLIVLACCCLHDLGPVERLFSTLIETRNFSPASLEAAADFLFLSGPTRDRALHMPALGEGPWRVNEWDPQRDSTNVSELLLRCLPSPFRLEHATLHRLLDRPGYSKHFVVLEPFTNKLIGFCATYTTFIDHSDSSWIGSLALLLVHPSYQRCGVGTALHSHALRQLLAHRVSRLQLGSTFPRILYGIPRNMPSGEEWFRRRGWRIDSSDAPGCGQEACDWLLDFADWRAAGLASRGLTFRKCHADEFDRVLEFVARESVRKDNVGWYDQYYQLANSNDIPTILLGFEDSVVVASALTYIPSKGGRAAEDLPWAGTISNDVGGVCCVCITDDHLSAAHSRDSVLIRLMDFCVRSFREQGLRKMFMDGIRGGYEGFQTIGFQKWAGYSDVWCEA